MTTQCDTTATGVLLNGIGNAMQSISEFTQTLAHASSPESDAGVGLSMSELINLNEKLNDLQSYMDELRQSIGTLMHAGWRDACGDSLEIGALYRKTTNDGKFYKLVAEFSIEKPCIKPVGSRSLLKGSDFVLPRENKAVVNLIKHQAISESTKRLKNHSQGVSHENTLT